MNDNSSKQKWREFWIKPMSDESDSGDYISDVPLVKAKYDYHVIEYSALTEAQARIEKLEAALIKVFNENIPAHVADIIEKSLGEENEK